MPKNGKIYEADLIDAFLNNAVEEINIIQTNTNKYQLVISLTWKEGEWKLATTRNSPREWVSLDRLISHILKNYKNFFSPINLFLSNEVSAPLTRVTLNEILKTVPKSLPRNRSESRVKVA